MQVDFNNGWLKLHRKIYEWEWYTDGNTFRLFLHLLLNANFEDKKWKGITIKKGELLTGRLKLADDLKLSEQQIRTSLNRLKSTNEITIKSTSQYSIISINNWEEYQQINQASNQQVTNNQPTSNQQVTTTKECKERKEHKEIYNDQFEIFYKKYPLKKSKDNAYSKFCSILKNKKATFEQIMTGLDNYINEIKIKGTEKQYIKHPSTWLNQGCWDDDYSEPTSHKSILDGINFD